MFAFGVDIPLVELLIGILVVSVIVLIELTIALVLIMHKLKASRQINAELRNLADTLLEVKNKELQLMGALKK